MHRKKLFVTAVFFINVLFVAAQITFLPYQDTAIGSRPRVLAIGDVNNDGLNDIVIGTGGYSDPANDFKIFIFTQNTLGNLNPPTKYTYTTLGAQLESIAIADLNNDNLNDVVIGYGDVIGILYQNTTGTLNAIQNLPSGNRVDGTKCGDLNNDGLTDIAVSHWYETFIRVFYQTSNGFTSSTYVKPAGGYDDIDVGDVNGDGLDDVVYMSGQGSSGIHVFTQNSTGTLNNYVSYFPASTTWNVLHAVSIGDLNNDGKNDVVASMGGNKPRAKIVLWLQDTATGLLQNTPTELLAWDIPEPIEIADLDCDGKNEIITTHGGWSNVSVYEQDPLGNYGAYTKFSVPYASHYPPDGMAVGDINSDGKKEIVIAEYNNGFVLLINNSVAFPSQIDTSSIIVQQDTIHSNTFQRTTYYSDTTVVLFNNYQITQIDYYVSKKVLREDSIRIDSIYILSSQFCEHTNTDTSIVSKTFYLLKELSSESTLLSTSSDTVNTIPAINIYPNPTSEFIYVDLPSPFDAKNLSIAIHTELGQLLFFKTYNDKRNKRQLSLSGFASGSYMITFSVGDKKETKKIIKVQ